MAAVSENLKKDLFILQNLITKDFKLKYRRSFLGVVWSVLNPLLMMLVLWVVFTKVFRFQIEHFSVYLILGMTLFNLMSNTTSSGVMSIINAAALIKKIRVNKLVFPLENVLFESLNFAISLVAVVVVIIIESIFSAAGPIVITPNVLLFPLVLFYVLLFSLGLCLLLSSLAVFFKDVIHLWSVVIVAWTYATPLFYPVAILENWAFIMEYNPMYQFITYFREIVMWGTTPSLTRNLVCFAMAAITFLIGYVVFRKTERKFILHV